MPSLALDYIALSLFPHFPHPRIRLLPIHPGGGGEFHFSGWVGGWVQPPPPPPGGAEFLEARKKVVGLK